MGQIFNNILVYPLLNLLIYFYNFIPDLGVVIIILTFLIRLLLYPSFHKSIKHQKMMQDLQPKMNEIKEKFKDDKEQQAKALMELYKVHKFNPLSSCFPLLIQLPILIALYQVFMRTLDGSLTGLYSFVVVPEQINHMFLGFVDLGAKNVYLAVLAAVSQYFASKQMADKAKKTPSSNNDALSSALKWQTLYFLPGLTFVFGLQFPAGLTLYWLASTLFGIGQQYILLRKEAKEAINATK